MVMIASLKQPLQLLSLTFFVLSPFLVPSTTAAQVDSEPFFGFSELFNSHFDGRVHSQSFSHQDDAGVTLLNYEVEPRDDRNILHLDTVSDEVLAVHCLQPADDHVPDTKFPTSLVVHASHTLAKRLINPKFEDAMWAISGSHRWGCRDAVGLASSLMFESLPGQTWQQIQHAKVDDTVVVLSLMVKPTGLQSFFRNADIHFRTTKFPADHFQSKSFLESVSHDSEQKVQSRRKVASTSSQASPGPSANGNKTIGWFGGYISKAWNAVTTIGTIVTKAVEVVETAVKIIRSDYDIDKQIYSKDLRWNLDGSLNVSCTNVSVDANVSCNNCSAHMHVDLDFKLKIVDLRLYKLELIGSGDVSIAIGANMQFHGYFHRANSTHVGTISMKPVIFTVGGITMNLTLQVPVMLGYDIEAQIHGLVDAHAELYGDVTFGVTYTPQAGVQYVNKPNFKHSGVLDSYVEANTDIILYVLPTFVLGLDHLGTTSLGLKVFIEESIDFDSGSFTWLDPCANCKGRVTTNVGVQTTISANISVTVAGYTIYRKEIAPLGVLSYKKPILTGCIGNQTTLSLNHKLSLDNLQRSAIPGLALHTSKTNFKSKERPVLVRDITGVVTGVARIHNPGYAVGTTWVGTATRGRGSNPVCDLYPPLRLLSFQAIAVKVTPQSGAMLTLFGSVNDARAPKDGGHAYSCVDQRQWVASTYNSGALIFKRTGIDVFTYCASEEAVCSCDNEETALPSSFVGQAGPGLSSIYLEDSLRCTEIYLERVMEGTSGMYYHPHGQKGNLSASAFGKCH
jgi:hypothetical protein